MFICGLVIALVMPARVSVLVLIVSFAHRAVLSLVRVMIAVMVIRVVVVVRMRRVRMLIEHRSCGAIDDRFQLIESTVGLEVLA